MKKVLSDMLQTAFATALLLCLCGGCAESSITPSLKDDTEDNSGSGSEKGETDSEGYALIWQDSFDGDSLSDDWTIEVNGNGGGNNELQYYCKENISVGTDPVHGNSALIITAKRESYAGKSFTSGRLTTSGKVEFTHGKVEGRIRFPQTSDGLWPAFWMLGADYATNSWPKCGEIDIVEMGHQDGIKAGTQDRYFNGACHWGYYKNGAYPNYARHTTNSYSITDGEYHLFTTVWTEEKISMYLDRDKYPSAEPYYEMNLTDMSDDWSVGYYFHHDYFIILNLAVGGNFPGIWNAAGITALPSDGSTACMYVDYVKVYQK